MRRVDPVCGKEVETRDAPSHDYGGHRFVFCGEDCRRRFAGDPRRYGGRVYDIPDDVLIDAERNAAWWFG